MSAAAESLSPRRVKLRPPRLPEDVVARARLLARLNRMAALTLVVAPAGYGKTTLVGSWLAQADRPRAWLSLDESDNDPAMFLAELTAALAAISAEFGAGVLEGINSPHTSTFADLAVLLINQLNELSGDFILVLDDYHVIHEPIIHQMLIDLVTYPPHAMHLVITTRHDLPLPWRVRTRSSLCELRAADLGFSEWEAAQFLAKVSDRPMTETDIRTLIVQSQGWITSLRLAALAMRIHAEDARWFDLANAGFRNFNDYFSSELFTGLPPHTLFFLLRTSVVDPLCGPLCDFVIAGTPGATGALDSSATLLRSLERIGAFTTALDDEGTWYRYHPLLREVLRRQLEQDAAESEIAGLYLRAAGWYEEQGLLDEALRYALASEQVQLAVEFLQRHRHQLLDNFEWRRLDRWFQQFPAGDVDSHLELLLTRAWLNQWRYNLPDVRTDLDRIEELLARLPAEEPQLGEWRGEIAALRSQQFVAMGDAGSAVTAAKAALTALPPGRFYTRTVAMVQLVFGGQMTGELQHALAYTNDIAAADGAPRDLSIARSLTLRAYADLPTTNLTAMRGDSDKLLQIVSARGQKTTVAWTHYFWGTACYLQNDLHGAAKRFGAVLELVDHAHALAYAHSAIGMALTYQAQGMAQEAQGVVEGAKRTVSSRQQTYVSMVMRAFAAELAARQGRVEEALRWVARESRQLVLDAIPMFYLAGLASVRVLLAAGSPEHLYTAQTWLERQMELAVRAHNTHAQIQCLALAAALHEAQGERPAALTALDRGLAMAQHGQVVRAFADLARELAPLFDTTAASHPLSGFRARVHNALQLENQSRTLSTPNTAAETPHATLQGAARAQGEGGEGDSTDKRDLRELLTFREMDVLRLLDQRLTNKEIAHILGISTETVRQHTVNLFRKLNVNNRRQAIVMARSWGYFHGRE